MSKDNTKRKYLSAYVPEAKPKETPKRDETKGSGRIEEIEEAIKALNDLLTKQNRDNLDALYNIDMSNMSSSMRRLFQSYDDGITKAQAEIKAWANAQEAGFSAIAEWQNKTTQSIAGIEGKADENSAEIESLARFQQTVEDGSISSIAGIKQTADANKSSIDLIAQWQQTVEDGSISSIASLQSIASSQGSQITALANWQSNTGNDLINSVAVLQAEANETGAALDLLVTYDRYGNVDGINAAEIAMAVSEEESFIRLIADKVEVQGNAYFMSLDGDGVTTINGDDITLIADAAGDSISRLAFRKWRYSDEEYNTNDNTLNTMFEIKTVDNESDDENYARFATMFQTYRCYEDSQRYYTAMKFISAGAMSFESGGSLYAAVDTYCTLDAGYNVRINAPLSYADACKTDFGGYTPARNSYVFCAEGIYYIDSDGGATVIAST